MAFFSFRLQGTPPGLERLLRSFRRNDNETAELTFLLPLLPFVSCLW